MTELKDLGLQSLKLNINNSIIEPIFAKEGDHKSRGLDIQVLKNNVVTDTTGVELDFYAKPRDGKTYMVRAIEIDVKRGKYEIIYPSVILQPGKVESEIVLTKGEQVISTKKFDLLVENTIATDDIVEKSDERPLLAILVEAAKNEKSRIEAESKRVVAEDERVETENQREKNESQRQRNEEERKQNEGQRQNIEIIRQENESIRQSQEQQRQESMSEIENRFSLLETSQQQDAEVINARTSTTKGKTFDNLNDRLEDTEKDIDQAEQNAKQYTDTEIEKVNNKIDKPLYSTPVETYNNIISLPNNTTNGQISGSIKGDTIVNHAGLSGKGFNSPAEDILVNQGILENGVLTMQEAPTGYSYKNFKLRTSPLKNNTEYTVVVEIIENTLSTSFTIIRPHEVGIESNVSIEPKKIGLVKIKFTTGNVVEDAFTSFARSSENIGYIKLKNLMILEGDYTSKPVPYIEGTKSTPAAFKIKSVGKNLLNVRDVLIDNKDLIEYVEYEGKKCLTWHQGGSAEDIKIMEGRFAPNTSYSITISAKSDSDQYNKTYIRVIYTDGTYHTIVGRGWSPETLTTTPKKSIDYITGLHYSSNSNMFVDMNSFQIERNNTATEYEPYKEDTSYVVAKNEDNKIVNLNRLPSGVCDEIDLEKKELVKMTNDYILQKEDIVFVSREKENIDYATIKLPEYAIGTKIPTAVIIPDIPFGEASIHDMDDKKYIGTWGGQSSNQGQIAYAVNKGTDIEQVREQLAGITLIYQLVSPEIIPVEIEGSLQGYKHGIVYLTPYIKYKSVVDDTKTINLQYSIKAIDKLIKLDTANAKWVEVEGALSEDGQTITVDTEGTYKVYGEIAEDYYTQGLKSIVTNINLNAQINSNTKAIERINNKIYADADLFTAMLLQQEVRITSLEQGGIA